MKDDHDNVTLDLLEHHELVSSTSASQEQTEPARRGKGRPAKHTSNAERQRAYRERLKAAGFREVRHLVRDISDETEPPKS